MKKINGFLFVSILSMMVSCTGLEGPQGEPGPMGPAGTSGATLIKTYTGYVTSYAQTVDVPEIYGKEDTTFVLVYSSTSEGPSLWIPMSDGYYTGMLAISWEYGKVAFFENYFGDYYMIKVYQNN